MIVWVVVFSSLILFVQTRHLLGINFGASTNYTLIEGCLSNFQWIDDEPPVELWYTIPLLGSVAIVIRDIDMVTLELYQFQEKTFLYNLSGSPIFHLPDIDFTKGWRVETSQLHIDVTVFIDIYVAFIHFRVPARFCIMSDLRISMDPHKGIDKFIELVQVDISAIHYTTKHWNYPLRWIVEMGIESSLEETKRVIGAAISRKLMIIYQKAILASRIVISCVCRRIVDPSFIIPYAKSFLQ